MSRKDPEARRQYNRAYYAANAEKIKAQSRGYAQAQQLSGVATARQRRYRYGITSLDVEALRAAQGGKCGICARDLSAAKVCVDHCHDSGKIRGLLCGGCNHREGWIRKYGEQLRAYLTSPPADAVLLQL